ncbi:MAG: Exporter of the RND superfamily protein-like protein [Mesotoga infera]|uniref:Exporter of the RND superfamily protein-like protein n=3 Tax=Mesotoga infera TaxID=1236046 RepID=A0A117LUD3_9BACT|nr:MAG: Exporter of the RND superfamily protein-like protein [Mesotoga infera]KUK91319.1 MAG: Exporter of the RND superfamily protein-like protein [Mesotoga infera]
MQRLSELVIKHRAAVIVFFIILGAFGAYLSMKLSVDSDLLKILPQDDPIVKQYNRFISADTSGGVTYVVLQTDDKTEKGKENLVAAARDIYDRAAEFKNIESFVRFDLMSDLGPLGLLMVDPAELASMRNRDKDLTRTVQMLVNYDFSAIRSLGQMLIGFEELKALVGDESHEDDFMNFVRLPESVPVNDPMVLVMGIRLDGPSSDVSYVKRVIPGLREWVTEISKSHGVSYGMAGDHFGTYDSHKQVSDDFILTTILSLAGISLLFFFAYSSLKITLYVFSSLAISMFITLGLSYMIFGSLNIITTFVTAITLGLGIDYGIHMLTRLSDGATREKNPVSLLHNSYKALIKPLSASMITTALVFAILAVIDSPAIRELGILSAIGIVVFFVVMTVYLPAISIKTVMDPGKKANIHLLDRFFQRISKLILRFGVVSGGVVFMLILMLSYLGLNNIRSFSYTPPGLMSTDSELIAVPSLIERTFGGSIINTVPFILPDIDSLRRAHEEIDQNPNFKSSFSILSVIEGGEGDHINQMQKVTREIDALRDSPLIEAVFKKANYYDFVVELLDRAGSIESSNDLIDLATEVIPVSLRNQLLYEAANGETYFVLNSEPSSTIYRNNVIKIIYDSLSPELKASFGGYPKVFHYLMDLVRIVSLPICLVAFAAIFVVVSFERKSIVDGLKTLVLMVGILMSMFGLMELIGIETTFVTVISAPLIIGIGVDSLVYVIYSSMDKKNSELARTFKSITMSSATTMLTFFSFIFAKGKLLSTFGISLGFGVLAALVVATFLVPVLPWNSKKKIGG